MAMSRHDHVDARAAVPAMTRTSVAVGTAWTYTPFPSRTRRPATTTTAAAARPAVNTTTPTTATFAASTRDRSGLAVKVVRTRPRRCSAATNPVPTTTATIRPTNVPARVWVMETPRPPAPATAGADVAGTGQPQVSTGLFESGGRPGRSRGARRAWGSRGVGGRAVDVPADDVRVPGRAAAGLHVVDLDAELGAAKSADLLISLDGASLRRLVEIKGVSGRAPENLVADLQRHRTPGRNYVPTSR